MNFWPVAETLNQLEIQLLLNYRHIAGGGGGATKVLFSTHLFVS